MTMKRIVLVVLATLAIGTGAGFAATLGIGSNHLWAGSQTLTKGTCTVTGAAADTYVNEASKTSSYGNTTTLDVNPDGNARRWAFLRFDLSSCALPSTAGADSATLSVYVSNAPNSAFTLSLAKVTSSWSTSLTWNGAQSLGYAADTDTSPSGTSTGTWVSFTVTGDVDDFIKGGTNNGWRIVESGTTHGTNRDLTQFNSSNASSNKPKLVIDYEK
jgi:hypothetical protein